jgi:S-adenosylmethionine hydrolase
MTPVISFLSDYGLRDPYVGEMKARILRLAPEARLVDLTHAIPAGDVAAGAFLLSRAWGAFGVGSVHLAVVDPGVGTSRPALAVRAGGHWFVGPDNGLLSLAAAVPDVIYRLDPERVSSGEGLSATFHGRDLFAPAAARIASGEDPSGFAVSAPSMVGLEPMVETIDSSLFGEVLWVDHFGNAITAIREDEIRGVGPSVEIRVAGVRVHELHSTFGDVEPLTPLAYIGSAGTLELAVRDGDLSERFGVHRGAPVEIRPARKD